MVNKDKVKKQQNPSDHTAEVIRDAAGTILLPARFVTQIAEEVAKRIHVPRRTPSRKKVKQIENAIFLDTSAIIDGRIFDVLGTGLASGVVVILESILSELKRIADSQDIVKRERGKKGLFLLDRLKRVRGVKVVVIPDKNGDSEPREVDEKLIKAAKENRGRVITCDYNLEKKASISGVTAINVHTLATFLKIRAVPGEALHIKILHKGKDVTQGVGYLDDGTMLVVEDASQQVGHFIDVIVSRVIQTAAGRILFAKKI